MHSHSSAYQPVPGAEAYSHPLSGGSGALVIEIFLSPCRKRRSAAMPRSGVRLFFFIPFVNRAGRCGPGSHSPAA